MPMAIRLIFRSISHYLVTIVTVQFISLSDPTNEPVSIMHSHHRQHTMHIIRYCFVIVHKRYDRLNITIGFYTIVDKATRRGAQPPSCTTRKTKWFRAHILAHTLPRLRPYKRDPFHASLCQETQIMTKRPRIPANFIFIAAGSQSRG
jgi:hypothetical protein